MGRQTNGKHRFPRLPKRRRSPPGSGWSVEAISEVPLGPGIQAASVEDTMAALERFAGGLGWDHAVGELVPLFQRIRPYPPGFPEAVRQVLPSGISVTFAIDSGPAFIHVTADMLESWDRSIAQVAVHGLENLRRRAASVDRSTIVLGSIGEVPLRILQSGTGSASTFVLVPEELPRLFGSAPQVFLAPMRDLLVALPGDVDFDFAAWLHYELAAPDPNCLAPVAFRYAGKRISAEALGVPAAIA